MDTLSNEQWSQTSDAFVLQSKLSPPILPTAHVSRPALHSRLTASLETRVAVLVAPAGFGKTSLVLDWLSTREEPSAWLSLEASENDLTSFLTYLIACLQTLSPHLGQQTLRQLQMFPQPPLNRLLGPLLNEMQQHKLTGIVVLDDFHHLTSSTIHEAFQLLLQHSPNSLHYVVTTRTQPEWSTSRWKAQRKLVELDATDLRFDRVQTEALFQQVFNAELDKEEVDTLCQRTEGWVTALHIAGLSLPPGEGRQDFIREFRGDFHSLSDFLLEEVFSELEPSLQQFLLQTSLLRRFSALLCRELLEIKSIEERLKEVEHRGLFLVSLDHRRECYRYHHLFQDWLQSRFQRLDPEGWRSAHQRAAQHFYKTRKLQEAFYHCLEAEDVEQMVLWLEKEAPEFCRKGRFFDFWRWLKKLPGNAYRQSPPLLLYRFSFLMQLGESRKAYQGLLEGLEHLPEPASEPSAEELGCRAFLKACKARFDNEPQRVLQETRVAIEQLQGVRPFLQMEAEFWMCRAMISKGGFTGESETQMLRLHSQCLRNGNLYHLPMITEIIATMCIISGKLRQAETLCLATLEAIQVRVPASELPLLSTAALFIALGEVAYLRNQREKAQAHVMEALRLAQAAQNGRLLLSARVFLALLRHIEGQKKEALQALERIEALPSYASRRNQWDTAKAMICLLKLGEEERFVQWMSRKDFQESTTFEFASHWDALTWCRWLLKQKQYTTLKKVLLSLESTLEQFGAEGQQWSRLLLMLALHVAEKRTEEARRLLVELLLKTRAEGVLRPFLDHREFVEPLLPELQSACSAEEWKVIEEVVVSLQKEFALESALSTREKSAERFGSHRSSDSFPQLEVMEQKQRMSLTVEQYLLEPLSPRELEVLELIALGCTNQVIAKQLFISLATVKTHARNIYGKLYVKNRTQAVQQARQLSLLS